MRLQPSRRSLVLPAWCITPGALTPALLLLTASSSCSLLLLALLLPLPLPSCDTMLTEVSTLLHPNWHLCRVQCASFKVR